MDTPNNNENKKGDGSNAVCSVDSSTLDDVLVRDNSKYDSTEDCSSKDSSSKESSKDSSSQESSIDSSSQESSKDSRSEERSKDSSSKESSKDSGSKESSKDSGSKESSKDSSSKENSKDSSSQESSKSSSAKSTEGGSTKDDNGNLHLVMEEDSQDHSSEQDSIGESIEEIAEEVVDEFEVVEEEGGGEAEADWPAEPQDVNSPDSPGEESPIHGPPAMELIVHEAASEGIVAPEDLVVFEPEVSVAVQVVHVVSVPVPVEELQPAPIVAEEQSSANSTVSVREQQLDTNVALPSSANPSVLAREHPHAANVSQQPSSANTPVPVRGQQLASDVAQPSSVNPSVPLREQQLASNVAQPSSVNPSVPLREQQQASNLAQPLSVNPFVPLREQQQASNLAQPSSSNPSIPVREQQNASNVVQQTPSLDASLNQNGAETSPADTLLEQQTTNPQPETPCSQPLSSFDRFSSDFWLSETQWLPDETSREESNLPMINTFPGSSLLLCSPEPRPVQLVRFSPSQSRWPEIDLNILNPIWPTRPGVYQFTPPVQQSSSPQREQATTVIAEDRAVPAPELYFTIAFAASAICGAIGIALFAVARYFNRR